MVRPELAGRQQELARRRQRRPDLRRLGRDPADEIRGGGVATRADDAWGGGGRIRATTSVHKAKEGCWRARAKGFSVNPGRRRLRLEQGSQGGGIDVRVGRQRSGNVGEATALEE